MGKRFIIRKCFCVLLVLIVAPAYFSLFAQQIKFEQYSTRDGLPQGVISSIMQDAQGFLWFSTHDGMARFDGYEFRVYQHNPDDSTSLPGNWIGLLREGKPGELWVILGVGGVAKFDQATEEFTYYQNDPNDSTSLGGNVLSSYLRTDEHKFWFGTINGGVSRYNPSADNFTQFTTSTGLASNKVNDIIQDNAGNIWVGTIGSGIDKIRPDGKIMHYSHEDGDRSTINNNTVHVFAKDASGHIWVATANGVCRYNPVSDDFSRLSELVTDSPVNLPQYTYRLYQDFHGDIWMVTVEGLYRFSQTEKTLSRFLTTEDTYALNRRNQITTFGEDSLGQLWIGSNTAGVFRYNRSADQLEQFRNIPGKASSLSHNNVSAIFTDNSGTLWIGTVGGGVNKYSYKKNKFNAVRFDSGEEKSVPNTGITAIYQDTNYLWLGTNKHGLFRYDPANDAYRNYLPGGERVAGNTVTVIFPAGNRDLWVGTITEGLNYFDVSEETYRHFPESDEQLNKLNTASITAIERGEDEILWIGTGNLGLCEFNPRTQSLQFYSNDPSDDSSLVSNIVWDVYKDRDSVLWVGTASGGLSRFNRERGTFTNYVYNPQDSTSLRNKTVTVLHEDRRGNFWVGTYSGGLNKMNRESGQFIHYSKEEGLSGNRINAIGEDTSGNLWVSTNQGITKVNPATEMMVNFDVSDGLQGNEFIRNSYFKTSDGEMYFGGLNGYSNFYPEKVTRNQFIPPVRITALRTFDQIKMNGYALDEIDRVRLSWKDNFFGFEFTALDFTNPGKNQYAYKMEGFDSEWIESGTRRYATYTNLDGGKYTFRVRGSNNDGIWNESGVSLHVVITPPFWRTSWFRVMAVLAILGAGATWYKMRIRRIQEHNRELQEEIRERIKAEQALAKEQQRLEVTLRSIGDGVIATDTDGKIVLMNRAAEELTGWPHGEAVGKPLAEVFTVVSEKTGDRDIDPVTKVLETNRHVHLSNHTKLQARDGHEYIIADSGAPIRDNSGEVQGVVLVFRDMTEKRKMEEEMLKAEKLKSIGVLAGGIAHDFNNILSAIIGNVYLAKTELNPDSKAYERLTEVENASGMATDLTTQLLTFSKGGAPVKETTSIGKVIKDSANFVLRGSNVRPEFDLPEDLWPAEVDVGQFSQVINNLVINADHAMPEGGVIELSAVNLEIGDAGNIPVESGKYIKVTIRDHGVGIPDEHLAKIFDPYFTTKSKGSGLGLASSFSIVKRHDGHISVESKQGEGTTFDIYLPASADVESKEAESGEVLQKGSGKILFMDDELIIQSLGKEMLSYLGYDVVTAQDGLRAIELYKDALDTDEAFDAVIMDLTIPGGMGGKEALEHLKKIDPAVQVIVSSGYAQDDTMARYTEYGFAGRISKPFTAEELASELHRVTTKNSNT